MLVCKLSILNCLIKHYSYVSGGQLVSVCESTSIKTNRTIKEMHPENSNRT